MTNQVLTIQEMASAPTDPGPTQMLAAFAATTTYDALPAPVVADAKLAILDWFGSMLAGSLEPPARMARSVVRLLGVADDAALFPAGRATAAGAAIGVLAFRDGERCREDRGRRVQRRALVDIIEFENMRGDAVGERGPGCRCAAMREECGVIGGAKQPRHLARDARRWFKRPRQHRAEPIEDRQLCLLDDRRR
jgi:hypothetical protein